MNVTGEYWPRIEPPAATVTVQFHDGLGCPLFVDQRLSIGGVCYVVKFVDHVSGYAILNLWL